MLARLLDCLDAAYAKQQQRPDSNWKQIKSRVLLSMLYHLNKFLCWYYHTISKRTLHALEECDYVVSLTTYPARIDNLWRVLEIIFHQHDLKEQYAVCLYLIEDEFKGIELPQSIKDLQKRGLTVKFEKENLKCHNKYFYAFQDFPNKNVITIDDDLQYNHHTISALVNTHKKFPKAVVYNRGAIITRASLNQFDAWARSKEPMTERKDVCPTGVGGVLYPPKSCSEHLLNNAIIRRTCLQADDMWLSFNERLAGSLMVYTGLASAFTILPDSNQENALYLSNVLGETSGNDIQIKQISEWATKELGCDFYVNII